MNVTLCSNESTRPDRVAHLESLVMGQLNRRIRAFRIVPRGEGLVLQGQSRTYYVKQLAQATLMASTDVPILANDIEVS